MPISTLSLCVSITGTFILLVPKHNLSLIISFSFFSCLSSFSLSLITTLVWTHTTPHLDCAAAPEAGLSWLHLLLHSAQCSIYSLCSYDCCLPILDGTATPITCKCDFYCLSSVQIHLVLFPSPHFCASQSLPRTFINLQDSLNEILFPCSTQHILSY